MWKRKRTLKEEYGTLGHFLRGDNDCHYLGDLYICLLYTSDAADE